MNVRAAGSPLCFAQASHVEGVFGGEVISRFPGLFLSVLPELPAPPIPAISRRRAGLNLEPCHPAYFRTGPSRGKPTFPFRMAEVYAGGLFCCLQGCSVVASRELPVAMAGFGGHAGPPLTSIPCFHTIFGKEGPMVSTSPVTLLFIAWAAVTAAFIAVMIWKSLAGMKEADVVILDEAETKQADEQQHVIAKMERLTFWAKSFGFTSLALLLLAGGLLAYRAIRAFNLGQTP